jgi:hypothetical protein
MFSAATAEETGAGTHAIADQQVHAAANEIRDALRDYNAYPGLFPLSRLSS